MQITGQRQLACTRGQAWLALNDPKLLQRCIPGCERFDPTGENAYALVVVLGFGPLTTHIRATLQLTDIQAPDSYRLAVRSDGGMAGHGTGTADIRLLEPGVAFASGADPETNADAAAPAPVRCVLDYRLDVQLGGKIAKWGARWTDAAAGTVVNGFFRRFEVELHHRLHPDDGAMKSGAGSAGPESARGGFGSKFGAVFGRRPR